MVGVREGWVLLVVEVFVCEVVLVVGGMMLVLVDGAGLVIGVLVVGVLVVEVLAAEVVVLGGLERVVSVGGAGLLVVVESMGGDGGVSVGAADIELVRLPEERSKYIND